ncbi:cytochrome c, partial [Staphylococcus aureus]|nr:cytochrome c [Staphylococcus aureus]
ANEAPSINKLSVFYDNTQLAKSDPVSHGMVVYNKNCTSCHGTNKQGNPPVFPSLVNLQKNEEQIRTILQQGKGIMPSFP